MAVLFIQEFKISGDDRMAGRLNVDMEPPDGLIAHTAGFDEDAGVVRILDSEVVGDQARPRLTGSLCVSRYSGPSP